MSVLIIVNKSLVMLIFVLGKAMYFEIKLVKIFYFS